MIEFTKSVKLVACRENTYTNYVFKDNESNEYIFCTRLPNWKIPEINIGDEGYIQYLKVKPGDEYLDIETGELIKYKYANTYLQNFVKLTDIINNKEIIL